MVVGFTVVVRQSDCARRFPRLLFVFCFCDSFRGFCVVIFGCCVEVSYVSTTLYKVLSNFSSSIKFDALSAATAEFVASVAVGTAFAHFAAHNRTKTIPINTNGFIICK